MSDQSTALAKANPTQFALLDPTKDAVKGLLQALGGKISPADVPKITLTLQGRWLISSPLGDQLVDSVEGIVIYSHPFRGLFEGSYDPSKGGQPPRCTSHDGIKGNGDPGTFCESCPFNAWGSAGSYFGTASKGKACKEYWYFYLWRAGKKRPELVQVPSTSLQNIKAYLMSLLDVTELDGLQIPIEGGETVPMPILGVVTRFTLSRDKGGVKVVPQVASLVPDDQWGRVTSAYAMLEGMVADQKRVNRENAPAQQQPRSTKGVDFSTIPRPRPTNSYQAVTEAEIAKLQGRYLTQEEYDNTQWANEDVAYYAQSRVREDEPTAPVNPIARTSRQPQYMAEGSHGSAAPVRKTMGGYDSPASPEFVADQIKLVEDTRRKSQAQIALETFEGSTLDPEPPVEVYADNDAPVKRAFQSPEMPAPPRKPAPKPQVVEVLPPDADDDGLEDIDI